MHRYIFLLLLLSCGSLQAQEPSPAQLLLVQAPGQSPEIVTAAAVEQRGKAVLYLGQDGSRNALQLDYIVGNVPLPNKPMQEWSQADWSQVKSKMQAATAARPQFASLGEQHLERLEKTMNKARANAQNNSAEQEWQALQKQRYQPSASREETLMVLEKASALTQQLPDKAPIISAWMQPWREHLQHLDAGQVYQNGSWQPSADQPASQAVAEPVKEASTSGGLTIERQVMPWLPMLGALIGVVGVTLLLFLIAFAGLRAIGRQMFASNLVTSSKQARSQAAKPKKNSFVTAIFTLLVIGFLVFEGYFLFQLFRGPSTLVSWESQTVPANDRDVQSLKRVFIPDASTEVPELEITAATANRALNKSPLWSADEESNPLALVRSGWAIELEPGTWRCAEQLQWLGQPFLITYTIPAGDAGGVVEIKCNGQPLPPWLAANLWQSFHDEVNRLVAVLREERQIEVAIQKDQTIRVRPVSSPASRQAAG